MKSLVKRLMPGFVKSSLRHDFRQGTMRSREEALSRLPQVPLEEKHVAGCRLVLNRKVMLEEIGKCSTVAELGVNRGEFSEIILETLKPDSLHLVDIWGNPRYHGGLFQEVTNKFSREIEKGQVKIQRTLSTDAAPEFPDGYFDLVYIDTNHSYETTRDELLAFEPKVKQGGIIAGHDYSMGDWLRGFRYGVIEAVHEFCVRRDWELCFLTAEPLESQSFAIRRSQSTTTTTSSPS